MKSTEEVASQKLANSLNSHLLLFVDTKIETTVAHRAWMLEVNSLQRKEPHLGPDLLTNLSGFLLVLFNIANLSDIDEDERRIIIS